MRRISDGWLLAGSIALGLLYLAGAVGGLYIVYHSIEEGEYGWAAVVALVFLTITQGQGGRDR